MRAWMLLLAVTVSAHAYEVDTHGRMTQTVFERSALKTDAALLSRLGLEIERLFDWDQRAADLCAPDPR